MDKPQIIINFEPTTTDGFMVSLHRVTDRMLYRQQYINRATYVFTSRKFEIHCVFNLSVICSEKHALKIATSMVKNYQSREEKK